MRFPAPGGYSSLQIKVLAFLLFTFFTGLVVKYWRASQPPPGVDPALEARFRAIADSLNAAESAVPEPTMSAPIGPVNINTATAAELERLPGIGPALSRRIFEDRARNGPYGRPEDLLRVRGIGRKTLEKLQEFITFD